MGSRLLLMLLVVQFCWLTMSTGDPLEETYIQRTDDISNSDTHIGHRQKRLIYIGTKWCGDGNVSTSYEDLGQKRELDMCCRDHDHCDTWILANSTRYGLFNPSSHTNSHCDCDAQFRQCLLDINNLDTSFVGGLFFSIQRCINFTYPAQCVHSVNNRCVKYEYNTSQPMVWQMFDLQPWKYNPNVPTTETPVTQVSSQSGYASLLSVSVTLTTAILVGIVSIHIP